MLGYGSSEYGYRVFNNTSGCVQIARDVTFDESDDSQEQLEPSVVGNEEPPCDAIKNLAIGEVRLQERKIKKRKMKQNGLLEALKQNLRKFCSNPWKFRSAEVPHLQGKLLKIKIKLFEILLLYPFKKLMMMKIKL